MWFDVALWLLWSPVSATSMLPASVAYVEASSAFATIEALMRCSVVWSMAHAAAAAMDGSLVYRAYGIRLAKRHEHCVSGKSVISTGELLNDGKPCGF